MTVLILCLGIVAWVAVQTFEDLREIRRTWRRR